MEALDEAGLSFAQLSALAQRLPGIEESTSYGTPALKVRGKLMARLLDDGSTLALRCNAQDRERLLRASPAIFYLTAHYQHHPWILVRLPALSSSGASTLLLAAWHEVAPASLKKLPIVQACD